MAAGTKKANGGRSWFLEASDQSLNDRMKQVRLAVDAKFNKGPGEYCYCEVVFDDHVIVQQGSKLWRVFYTVNADGGVTLSGEPVEVRVTYSPVAEGTIFDLLPDDDAKPVTEGEEPAAPATPTGRRWGVLIIQEGMSKNRNRYARKVLQEAAPKYEGADVFTDHKETPRYGRSVHDKAGFLKNVQPVLLGGKTTEAEAPATLALAATLVVTKAWVREEMVAAFEEGNPNLFGLSHDAMCRSTTCVDQQQEAFYDVTKIESVQSVDLVTNPAAGGRVLRLVASETKPHSLTEDGNMLKKMIEAIKTSGNAALIAKLEGLGSEPSEDQILEIYQGLAKQTTAPAKESKESKDADAKAKKEAEDKAAADAAKATKEADDAKAKKEAKADDAKPTKEAAQVQELLKDNRQMFLETTLAGTSLPDLAKDRIKARFADDFDAGRLPTKEAITKAVSGEVEYFGKLAEANIVMPAIGRPRVEITRDRKSKIEEALDEFFGVTKDDKLPGGYRATEGNDRKLVSFRNLYADITGDRDVTGKVAEATRLTEGLTTASFDQILGDSITRRMVAEYRTQSYMNQWRGTIADVVPLNDFRTQRRMRMGGYGNLATVAQGAPYVAMTSPTDEEATYAPSKRGGTEQITIEMIANDDVGAIRRIPTKMAKAAGHTLFEFVFNFMADNPLIYDGVALAAARSGAGNISTTAMSASQVQLLRQAIKKQADMDSGKRMGLPARYLFVPTELEELAFWLTQSDKVIPDTNITTTAEPAAGNFARKLGIQPITVDYWTDTNNYWLTSSVQDTPMIEVGFLGGREDPELFVQDQPNVGSLFSNDVITYKIRHIYGGAVLDFRGFAGGIVA